MGPSRKVSGPLLTGRSPKSLEDGSSISRRGDAALIEWRRLIVAEARLRKRIHHQHRLIIEELETPEERADMRVVLDTANRLLAELTNLLGEAGAADVLGHGQ
jgi:hypothetical protein